IRPESWMLGIEPGATNAVPGRIGDRVYLGEMAQYQLAAAGHTLTVYEMNPRFVELSPDREVFASVSPEDVVVLPRA
ncbi:MAG TPA: TOBE domain-containing protein, partial [Chthoniobacteraceae bacterium]